MLRSTDDVWSVHVPLPRPARPGSNRYPPRTGILNFARFSLPRIHSQAFSFGKGDDIALAYLKELRQNGTDRRTEMSTLISGGFLEYQAIKEAEEAEVSTTADYGTKNRAHG